MKNKAIYIILFISGMVLNSCQKMEYEKEYNWAYPVSGDWVVNATLGEDTFGPIYLKTYNSAVGQDSIWVDDHSDFYWFNNEGKLKITPLKAKVKVDMKNLTFQAAKSITITGEEDIEVMISKGKLVGNDSIYFELEFINHPDTVFIFGGHRKASYEEYLDGLN